MSLANVMTKTPFRFVVKEVRGPWWSKKQLLIAASQTVLVGSLLGAVALNAGAVTVGAPAFTGTGDGALTRANPAYGAGVQEGTYIVKLIEAAANAGQFEVIRPDGTVDGFATVGVAYDGQIKFTIADGTDFANAAKFTLAVAIAEAGDASEWKVVDPDAVDGSQVARAIAGEAVTTAAEETATIAATRRDTVVSKKELEFGEMSDPEIAVAIAQLDANSGIQVEA